MPRIALARRSFEGTKVGAVIFRARHQNDALQMARSGIDRLYCVDQHVTIVRDVGSVTCCGAGGRAERCVEHVSRLRAAGELRLDIVSIEQIDADMAIASGIGYGAARQADYRPFLVSQKPLDDVAPDHSECADYNGLLAPLHVSALVALIRHYLQACSSRRASINAFLFQSMQRVWI
jgi:hypothetical protein